EEIGELKYLERLTLGANFKEVPAILKNCKNLKSIYFSGSNITEIPDWFYRRFTYANGAFCLSDQQRISKDVFFGIGYFQLRRVPFRLSFERYFTIDKIDLFRWLFCDGGC